MWTKLHQTLWIVALLLAGCSRPVERLTIRAECTFTRCTPMLADLREYPQSITPYLEHVVERPARIAAQMNYARHYYRVWTDAYAPPLPEEASWPFRRYHADDAYGPNLLPHPLQWFVDMNESAAWHRYGSIAVPAMARKHLDLRNFPTDTALFHDPRRGGEGYPFDYLQNSSVFATEPLWLSHYSRNRAWAYVTTAYAGGWVNARDIATEIPAAAMTDLIAMTADHVPLYSTQGRFITDGRIGMVFAAAEDNADHYIVPFAKTPLVVPKNAASPAPLRWNRDNVYRIATALLPTRYGWGGYGGERDCSSTLRDFFAPFGVWLPRNSHQQAQVGSKVMLDGLSDAEKAAIIRTQGIAFETLLYLPGHIMLYLGTYRGEPMVLHTIWGVRTGDPEASGRFIIGGTVISTLRPGRELEDADPQNSLLHKLVSMNFVLRP